MSMRRGRAGFTLVEVLLVSAMLGILAGIATPMLTRAINKAGAAKIAADARTLTVAVRSFTETGGALPATEAWGVAPSSLGPYLQENMSFSFRDAEYRFVTQPLIGVAQLWVRYPAGSGLGAALQQFRRAGEVTWTPTQTTFVLVQ
jgi:prepilin-type N-terminal cleavage/methylation domain-containing protein